MRYNEGCDDHCYGPSGSADHARTSSQDAGDEPDHEGGIKTGQWAEASNERKGNSLWNQGHGNGESAEDFKSVIHGLAEVKKGDAHGVGAEKEAAKVLRRFDFPMFVHMRLARNILSVVLAFAVGSTTMFLLHDLHMSIWPEETMPAATASREEFQAWMAGLSMTTMLAATVVHWLGTAAGVATGMLVAARSEADGKCAMWPAWTMGIWFFVGGILNSIQLGTPVWLSVVDALGYLPAAYAVSRLLRR